mmetsp:Transcript_37497/g.115790  ORF Transcript_37497/g.115790 Transcript_37497/m.115790 type:complete len:346 (-) Transcript_37497:116-1153(-)
MGGVVARTGGAVAVVPRAEVAGEPHLRGARAHLMPLLFHQGHGVIEGHPLLRRQVAHRDHPAAALPRLAMHVRGRAQVGRDGFHALDNAGDLGVVGAVGAHVRDLEQLGVEHAQLVRPVAVVREAREGDAEPFHFGLREAADDEADLGLALLALGADLLQVVAGRAHLGHDRERAEDKGVGNPVPVLELVREAHLAAEVARCRGGRERAPEETGGGGGAERGADGGADARLVGALDRDVRFAALEIEEPLFFKLPMLLLQRQVLLLLGRSERLAVGPLAPGAELDEAVLLLPAEARGRRRTAARTWGGHGFVVVITIPIVALCCVPRHYDLLDSDGQKRLRKQQK